MISFAAFVAACSSNNSSEAPPTPIDHSPVGPSRDFGVTVTADRPPPPISGGTLLVSDDGARAYASDSDRDQVYLVDLAKDELAATVALQPNDEPGRLVEDDAGRVHVVLRGAGAIATIDPATNAVTERRPVCPIPRGIAFDGAVKKLHVACASGELVTLPLTGTVGARVVQLVDDLRDVIVKDDHLLISRFRSGELLTVDREGKELFRTRLRPVAAGPDPMTGAPQVFDPAVAWRMRALPKSNGVMMVHQRGGAKPVSTSTGGYGSSGGCGTAIVHSTVSAIDATGAVSDGVAIPGSVLPVDIAVNDDESQIVVVNAGNWKGDEPRVHLMRRGVILPPSGAGGGSIPSFDCPEILPIAQPVGNAIAAAFDKRNRALIQTREPAALFIAIGGKTISLSSVSVEDTGHAIFHLAAAPHGGVACASCHPEGGEDGRAWVFEGLGRRRTQTLRGGIMQTAPFHWAGDESDISALMNDVFARRMGGGQLTPDRVTALSRWLDRVPALPKIAPRDLDAVARGKKLYDGEAQCISCHNGPLLTNHQTVDVGTGAPFQVPVLTGIRFRAPFMHDGCAPTLFDRFGSCGGGDAHGKTSQLTKEQIADLVAYLETL